VVSPARRARATWAAADAELAAEVAQRSDERIYANTVRDLLAVVEDLDPAVGTVALVGHNPSMHALAQRWGGELDEFPTCSVAVVQLDGEWASVAGTDGRVVAFATCRDEA
jgi:phosphohistidine phosphatase